MDATQGDTSRDRISPARRDLEEKRAMGAPNRIMTPGVFSLMELPVELRLKILAYLLISNQENIRIDSTQQGACIQRKPSTAEYPSVAILQTCMRVNEEGTPILYSHHSFTICLRNFPLPLALEPKQHPRQSSAFFLRPLRWSTISYLSSLSFISNSPSLIGGGIANPDDNYAYNRQRAVFFCTGPQLLSRFTESDFRYSPEGPDEYMVLTMSNYVSTQVMRAELSAFQRELEAMMRPSEEYAAAMADDPAT